MLLISLPVESFFLSKKVSTYPTYGIYETTYDESVNITLAETNYYKKEDIIEGLYVKNYTKYYDSAIDGYYYRFIELIPAGNYLDLNNLNKEDVYAIIREVEALKTTYDRQGSSSLKDIVNKAYFEIINYELLEDEEKDATNWLMFSLYLALCLIVTILVEFAIRRGCKDPDVSTLLKALKKNKDLKERLERLQESNTLNKEEIANIQKELEKLVAENKDKLIEVYEVINSVKVDLRFSELLKILSTKTEETKSLETRVLKK